MVLNPLFVQSVCVFMYVPNDMHVFVGVSCMCLWVFVGVCGCLWVFVGVCVHLNTTPEKPGSVNVLH